MTTPHLFVYGTLKPNASQELGRAERVRLAAEATPVGTATTRGKLIDLGAYPGLIEGCEIAQGFVYALRDPVHTLAWLDAYEGITAAPTDEYRREQRLVTMSSGTTMSCWVYEYLPSTLMR